ncbi:glycosyltransferase [Curtobacterium sp. MCPF17_001]|uniref:WecB/TagA/CpsF family glycosyltransferase n=1 Tax=Curtobacterium sp. MCPF17_001 TaxID=2175651 RepID=UPI000DAA409C|nr:WecB/TagA/CpsF family glycosyltransferase [Curtobacterium sp. MCPF17_001]PZE61605.1 glycosyltransferase [Curtobacterium sp. MCPF17_001]
MISEDTHSQPSESSQGRALIDLLPRIRVAGVPLVAVPADDLLKRLSLVAGDLRGEGVAVHFVNAYTVSLTHDERYLRLFNSRAVNLADGTPLAWLATRQRSDVAHVRGPDAFRAILAAGDGGMRHFLLGGTEESLGRLQATVAREFPSARVVGAFSPPFRELTGIELRAVDDKITASGANMIWVGIGTPKQDYEVDRLAREHAAVVLAVGAAFNFLSGDVVEAPALVRRTGLEWLFRLVREPRRLWRRYLIGNLGFLALAWKRRNE